MKPNSRIIFFILFLNCQDEFLFLFMNKNKISGGIDNFLPSRQLFRKQKIIEHSGLSETEPTPHIHNAQKAHLKREAHQHQYYLLNEIKQFGDKNKEKSQMSSKEGKNQKIYTNNNEKERVRKKNGIRIIDGQNYESSVRQIGNKFHRQTEQGQERNRQVLQNSPKKPEDKSGGKYEQNKKNYTSSQIYPQTVMNYSPNKYFDSCKEQALSLLNKIQFALISQKNRLKTAANQIRKNIQLFHERESQNLKLKLYQIADEIANLWKIQRQNKAQFEEIKYLGQLLQLDTQVDGRLMDITKSKQQILNQHNWKIKASQLLVGNCEEDILILSNLCSKGISIVMQQSQDYIVLQQKKCLNKVIELQSFFMIQLKQYLDHNQNLQEQQKQGTGVAGIPNTYSLFNKQKIIDGKRQVKEIRYLEDD